MFAVQGSSEISISDFLKGDPEARVGNARDLEGMRIALNKFAIFECKDIAINEISVRYQNLSRAKAVIEKVI